MFNSGNQASVNIGDTEAASYVAKGTRLDFTRSLRMVSVAVPPVSA